MDLIRKTQSNDLLRSLFMGIIESGYTSIAILVALRFFQASAGVKSLLAAGTSIGFLLSPVVLVSVARTSLPGSKICSLYMLGTSIGVFVAAFAGNTLAYTAGLLLATILSSQIPPVMVQIYSRNYHKKERARRISGNLMVASTVGACTSYLIGIFLDHDLSNFRLCLAGIGTACLCASIIHLRIPSTPLREADSPHLVHDLKLAFQDKFFAAMLIGWMLMGVGNLITIPLRIEYLANEKYGINASNTTVLAIALITTSVARVLSTPVWAWLFDKFNLALVRIGINLCFLTGLLLYFHVHDFLLLAVGAFLIGWATGGGTLAWNLWVTKVAPPGRESTYMSVHSFFTGIRGVPAPFVGYWILATYGPNPVGWTAAAFIATSSLLFLIMASNQRLKD